jgi:uncharacterized protein YndB with AHSA1/START domain
VLAYLLIGLAALIVLLVVIVVARPDDFRVSRSTSIAAPPAEVFAQVNDFHNWDAWSPWAKLDPTCRNSFSGAPAGQGAVFSWDGNRKVGAGRMTMTDSQPPELIRIRLEFLRPFKATNTSEFTFQSQGGQTAVTWSMYGKNNFLSKAFGLFMDCDTMVGADFEKGLASLKSALESTAKPTP